MGYPSFNAGDVLTNTDMNAVALWKITTATVTSVGGTAATASDGTISIGTGNTSLTINSAFSANFDAYDILLTGGTGSLVTGLNLTFGSAITGYYMARSYVDWPTATYNDTSINNGTSFTTVGAMTTFGLSLDLRVMNPYLAARTEIKGRFSTMGTVNESQWLGGYLNDANQYTSFTIACAAGSITGGKIRIYGYRN